MEKDMRLQGVKGTRYMYHDPCHTPMKTYKPLEVTNKLMGTEVQLNDRCCGESGTFAASRPDIATQVKFRKQEELVKGMEKMGLTVGEPEMPVKILTSCPSCLQGLARYGDDTGITADYIVVEMAKHILGENWMQEYVEKANNGGIEKVLL
jgi:Fe-S oxidoreductase